MRTGSSDLRPFKKFQIRWKEKLGYQDCPYLIRWTFIFFGYSIRIHHWIKSDDDRFFHDHSSDLISIVLKGHYWNVTPIYPNDPPEIEITSSKWFRGKAYVNNKIENYVEGMFNSWRNFFHFWESIWFSKAESQHYLRIPKGGAWTLMFEGRPRQNWGFFVNRHKWRPLRYFHKFGIRQTKSYQ